jgi:glycosyltransferase involved in cell wall biosynthesis
MDTTNRIPPGRTLLYPHQAKVNAMGANDQPRIAYFTPEFRVTKNSIFQSQVLEQAASLAEVGYKCMLIGSELNNESIRQAKDLPVVRQLDAVHLWPEYPEKASAFALFRSSRKVGYWAGDAISKWRPDAIYIRNVTAFNPARKLAQKVGARLIYDARGLVAEESEYRRGRRTLATRYLRWKERNCWRKADRLVCVSKRFQQWISTEIGRNDIEMVPCCVNPVKFHFNPDSRTRIKQMLGWEQDAPVVVYCGGLSVWQRTNDVLQLMSAMKRIEPKLKCLMLTGSVDEMTQLAKMTGLQPEDYECRSVHHSEVPAWLSVADVGVILRNNIHVNNVASPVKISEYLACRLGVIASEGIGDLSELLSKNGLGTILHAEDTNKTMASKAVTLLKQAVSSPELAQRTETFINKHLSWSSYRNVYQRLIVGEPGNYCQAE